MAPMFIPIESLKTKFYQKEYDSKKFLELSEEQLSSLAKKVYKMQEKTEDNAMYKTERALRLERYQRALQYITNPYIHLELKTFDERVAYLIMMSDPNLVTFKESLKFDFISIADISKIEDEKKRNQLIALRNQSITE